MMKSEAFDYSDLKSGSRSAPEICCESSTKNKLSTADQAQLEKFRRSSTGNLKAKSSNADTGTVAACRGQVGTMNSCGSGSDASERLSPAQFFHSRRTRNIELASKLGLAVQCRPPTSVERAASEKSENSVDRSSSSSPVPNHTRRESSNGIKARATTSATPAETFDDLVKSFAKGMSMKDKKNDKEQDEDSSSLNTSAGKKGTDEEQSSAEQPQILERGPVSVRTTRTYYSVPYQLPAESRVASGHKRDMTVYPPPTAASLPHSYYKEFPFPHFYSHSCEYYYTSAPPAGVDEKPPRFPPQLVPVIPSSVAAQRTSVPLADNTQYTQNVVEGSGGIDGRYAPTYQYQEISHATEQLSMGNDIRPMGPAATVRYDGCAPNEPTICAPDSELAFKEELPEILSDFILKYSRRYAAEGGDLRCKTEESLSEKFIYGDVVNACQQEEQSFDCSPLSAQSGGDSSPAAPVNTEVRLVLPSVPPLPQVQTSVVPDDPQMFVKQTVLDSENIPPCSPDSNSPSGKMTGGDRRVTAANSMRNVARQKLKALIRVSDLEAAWAWAVHCILTFPGAFYYRDADGDSLLHIVVWHKDYAKIYALTELMIKQKEGQEPPPFDLPNKQNEASTPLFLAVQKRLEEVVAYLIACKANPNVRCKNCDEDTPLHFAASRGMTNIVKALCSSEKVDLNVKNKLGLSPLLCAAKHHGVIEEETGCFVDNLPIIQYLLQRGANPLDQDKSTGKTIIHYSVEKMDHTLIEKIASCLPGGIMNQLMRVAMYNGDTPLMLLDRLERCTSASSNQDEKRKSFRKFIESGSDINITDLQDDFDVDELQDTFF